VAEAYVAMVSLVLASNTLQRNKFRIEFYDLL